MLSIWPLAGDDQRVDVDEDDETVATFELVQVGWLRLWRVTTSADVAEGKL